jgi:hypothetical protein
VTDAKIIYATINVTLKPWEAPNFAVRATATVPGAEMAGIPVKELDDDTLEAMALAWVRDLYRKAGRTRCPFREIPKGVQE